MYVSTDCSAYVCWLCHTYRNATYACPLLSPEQRMFTAYRNNSHLMETRPGALNLLWQSAGQGHPASKFIESFGWRLTPCSKTGRVSSQRTPSSRSTQLPPGGNEVSPPRWKRGQRQFSATSRGIKCDYVPTGLGRGSVSPTCGGSRRKTGSSCPPDPAKFGLRSSRSRSTRITRR